MRDQSNGYEAIAADFERIRSPSIGRSAVLRWAERLPSGASILDLGCGNGIPISRALMDAGFTVFGVDASETLAGQFRRRFPHATVECNSVEDSPFFDRSFEGIVAWGLMFLLPAAAQQLVIGKAARALEPQGHFVFTAPRQILSWDDALTGLPSISLGHDAYARELTANGLTLVGNDEDEGQNYYYFATKL